MPVYSSQCRDPLHLPPKNGSGLLHKNHWMFYFIRMNRFKPKKSKKYSKSSNFAKRSLFFWHYKTHDIFIKTASGKDEKLSNGLVSQNCPVCQILHNQRCISAENSTISDRMGGCFTRQFEAYNLILKTFCHCLGTVFTIILLIKTWINKCLF